MALYPGFYPGATTFPGVVYPENDPTWWLGPMGGLRRIPCPERDISMSQIRTGGTHRGLSGARTSDTTGNKTDYKFNFKLLEPDEWQWIEMLHTRIVRGPYYLINPIKKNRLSLRAVQGMDMFPLGTILGGVSTGTAMSRVADFPPGLGFPVSAVELQAYQASDMSAIFDRGQPFPLLRGETVSMGIWVRSTSGTLNVRLRVDWYYGPGQYGYPQGSPVFEIGTSWTKLTFEAAMVPVGIHGATFGVMVAQPYEGNKLRWAAPQINGGSSLAPFDPGGGAPMVLIDQLTTSSPRYPLRDGELTVLEA